MAEKAGVQAKTQESKQKCSSSSNQKSICSSSSSPADRILQLQRTAGNKAVQRLIKATTSARKEGKSFSKSSAESEKTSAPQAKKENESPTAADEVILEETFAEPAVSKEISRAPATSNQDPDFQKAKNQVRTEAKRQKKHDLTSKKLEEAKNASVMTVKEQEDQSSKEENTKEMERVGEKQQKMGEKFDALTFKNDLLSRLQGKGPKTEEQAREFAHKPPIGHFEDPFSENIALEQSKVIKPLEEKADSNPKGDVTGKKAKEIPKPFYPPPPQPVDPKKVAPKAKTDQEVSFQRESAHIDGVMQKNRLSDEQLAESREPSFLNTLKVKQETQQKIAEAPAVYRQQESAILRRAEAQSSESLTTELEGMNKIHHQISGHIFGSQKNTETETIKRQREIKKNIDDIYQGTVNAVKNILKDMADKVKKDFTASLRKQTDTFNNKVNDRLDGYYTAGKKVKHFFLGEPRVVVNEKTDTVRPLTPEDYDLSSFPPRIKAGVDWINPEVYEIFLQEKNNFINEMYRQLDAIAEDVTTGLTAARNQIQLGKIAIAIYKATLKGEEFVFAEQLGREVEVKFENLESSIDNTREDLLQTLADQYNENINQLKKTFNEINDELKKSWVDRAIEFIETAGKTIYQLAELLLSIMERVAHLVWDIIKHPIRFFETLVSGLKQGIDMFIDNIGTYMQEAFWTWITGATPVKNIRLSASSGIESLFDLVMQVLLGPAELRAIVEKKLGKEFMQMVDKGMAFGEKVLEPVTILLSKGPVAFWEYIKDEVGSIIQSSFDRIKESIFYAFVEKGLKWIAGFFIPGGGFVKIVKAIFRAFQFVAENLENIRHFFDSIFDSMEAAIEGRTEGVASKIITGLKAGVVLALDFLAKQLGLNKIVDGVQKIIQSLRRPIVNAIEWVLDKAKPFVMKIMKKGKELFEKGKAKVIGAGKAVVQVGVPEDPNERLRLAARASVSAARKLTGRVTKALLNPILTGIKVRYGLTDIQPYMKDETWWVKATVNPTVYQDLGVPSNVPASQKGSESISAITPAAQPPPLTVGTILTVNRETEPVRCVFVGYGEDITYKDGSKDKSVRIKLPTDEVRKFGFKGFGVIWFVPPPSATPPPVVHYSSVDFPFIHQNIKTAIALGKPRRLRYLKDSAKADANRRAALADHRPAKSGFSLDEYPFASTYQGGAGAEVMEVPENEQDKQGGKMSSFYQKYKLQDADEFDVMV